MLELMALIGAVDDIFKLSTPPFLMRTYAPPDGVQSLKDTEWSQPAPESPSIPYVRQAKVFLAVSNLSY